MFGRMHRPNSELCQNTGHFHHPGESCIRLLTKPLLPDAITVLNSITSISPTFIDLLDSEDCEGSLILLWQTSSFTSVST